MTKTTKREQEAKRALFRKIQDASKESAYVVMREGQVVAQILVLFPRDGAGKVRAAVRFLHDPNDVIIDSASASGYGYNKEGACFASLGLERLWGGEPGSLYAKFESRDASQIFAEHGLQLILATL